MIDRREFLTALAGLGGNLLLPPKSQLPDNFIRVVANPTLFFALPDGRSALVRFVVEGASAPAGRLRVFDRARRQLGTAGVIGVGGQLYGELWLPLGREIEIVSELELPGTRGPLRTIHRLKPRRRWTVYWMTAADSLSAAPDPDFLDHAALLRVASGTHPHATSFAFDRDGLLDRIATAPLVLSGSGLQWIGVRNAATPLARVTSHDGSAVIAVALAAAGTSDALGIGSGRNEMTRRIEQWLEGPGAQLADDRNAIALVVGTDGGNALADRVADWNSRFAHPRLVADRPAELLSIIEKRAPTIPAGGLGGATENARWQRAEPGHAAQADRVFEPLTTRLAGTATGLRGLAEQFAFRVPGTLVVNPTPFTTSALVTMPDGTERMVTDVPAWGYVCVPGHSDRSGPPGQSARPEPGRWSPIPDSDNDLTLDGRHFQARIDLESGAIRSLVSRANGREWVRHGAGVNTAPGFRLATLLKFHNPGIGTRILVGRQSSEGLTLSSSITVYDDLPWVDMVNRVSPAPSAPPPSGEGGGPGETPVTYGFGFALERPAVSWEIPAGFDQHAVPIGRLVHLRWVRLAAGPDTVLFRGLDAPVASVTENGEIVSVAPPESARYRLAFAAGYSAPQDASAFGWGTEPLIALPVPGTGRATLPSFGSLLVTSQVGVCIVDLQRDGDEVILYLQELNGLARDITVGPGVLTFSRAHRVDFGGRGLGELPALPGGGTIVQVRAHGITAVRLSGVELAVK